MSYCTRPTQMKERKIRENENRMLYLIKAKWVFWICAGKHTDKAVTDCLPRRCGICLYRKQGDQSRGKFESNRIVWKNLGPWRSLIAYTCKASRMVWDPLIVLFLLLMWLIKLLLLLFKEGIVSGINGHLTLIINYAMECFSFINLILIKSSLV